MSEDADNPDIVGECCRWMRMGLTTAKGSPFCIEGGLIDLEALPVPNRGKIIEDFYLARGIIRPRKLEQ